MGAVDGCSIGERAQFFCNDVLKGLLSVRDPTAQSGHFADEGAPGLRSQAGERCNRECRDREACGGHGPPLRTSDEGHRHRNKWGLIAQKPISVPAMRGRSSSRRMAAPRSPASRGSAWPLMIAIHTAGKATAKRMPSLPTTCRTASQQTARPAPSQMTKAYQYG